ncbi:hypothetical protein ABB37_03226 [Leptomonas pyrrhocoris]|uniref:Nuclear cap binding complex subunit CBP110 n=1 Tax=Leptomonas pyrrhocoris TaxID=157538 RepID=A0A0M9G4F9_LEPPY|nr:hypothetical protein ABB37_03226 [Leptomonas pyrrhocoris]KPA82063.1 hypothetical protein ABB37_03226 [Leptomonas pyrrhocoris]|eukprot:XP_015660502.1 hypothetical protein ABB37_03226 [Leptomonas pyrrhocoris]
MAASAQDGVAAAVAYSASLLEAVGYTKAGGEVQPFLQACTFNVGVAACAVGASEHPLRWLDVLSARVRRHAAQLVSSPPEVSSTLTTVLQETQQQYETEKSRARSSAVLSPCDGLFVALTDDYLTHTSAGRRAGVHYGSHASLFQLALPAPPSSSSSSSAAGTAEHPAAVRQQRQWCEARLYAALACAASITAPGPLARLLVAYANAHDGRLQTVADDNLFTHLRAVHSDHATLSVALRDATEEAGAKRQHKRQETSALAEAAAQVRVRLSGVVAGVLEYALHVAHTRSAATVAALNAVAHPAPSTATPPLVHPFSSEELTNFSSVSQSAVLLLVQLTEEGGHYTQTASTAGSGARDAASESTATSAAMEIVHAIQELLFTVVLGGGTQAMQNRPEPITSKKPISAAATVASAVSGSTNATAAAAATPLLVTTTRGVSLPEADTIVQELFPALVQQLGMEWLWSPLLRHLSMLDKQQQQQQTAKAASNNGGGREGATPSHLAQLPVRWSSHALMDAVLLSVAQKTYPQRLLNILPGSYERLLRNLNLLPPMPLQGVDSAAETSTGRAPQAALFDMPAYYAGPATALASYFQRAGVSGLRLDEVSRILMTATSSYAMLVRLKAQAPPLTEAGEEDDERMREEEDINGIDSAVDGGETKKPGKNSTAALPHTYALSRERVSHLMARYEGEVLLAAVVVYTQLRIPSQVQQLMRTLAPLFLKIHLDWRTHHDGSIDSWFLQHSSDAATGTRSVRFSNEAVVLLDKVGYEFYPLEWLPAIAASVCAASTTTTGLSSPSPPLPYSLCAAVSHQFRLQLRGTPLGSSGDVTLRHPAGPRTSVVMPSADTLVLFPVQEKGSGGEAETTAAAWRRAERFLCGFMQACYLDPKTSSTELEGTLAVSSTRRVLTTREGPSQGGYGGSAVVGGTLLVTSADIASQRLRSLLQQHEVLNAMWGSMETRGKTAALRSGDRAGQQQQQQQQEQPQRGRKRSREVAPQEPEHAGGPQQLRAMRQLLLDYGASSFETTVEAVDFALTVAQGFLPSTAGMSAVATKRAKKSDALLHSALEWSRAVVGSSANRARINILLQQQQDSADAVSGGAIASFLPLGNAYNSATLDMAWLARRTLRHVPGRIWEKIALQRTQAYALAQREAKWVSRLPGSSVTAASGDEEERVLEKYRVDPLLLEQWTQWVRVWQQLGLADMMGGGDSFEAPLSSSVVPKSAEGMSYAQWLWYSPYFLSEWLKN